MEGKFGSKKEADSCFLNAVSVTTARCGCKIVFIDKTKRIVEFDGPDENEKKCTRELTKIFQGVELKKKWEN